MGSIMVGIFVRSRGTLRNHAKQYPLVVWECLL
ncbi:hypothetical protein APH_0095 [Anaplasma phagocytophilum str. HZ]|uniref:Uncharacterized protein n=1 Tax=Anaplasma phagocytophilum (strain HZ) TaxID=212042 RepID=Q2GLM8_ANAPZ|nr:hypothetical protein APH_0095 [Anaplasma phagocytophilum str. HZ]